MTVTYTGSKSMRTSYSCSRRWKPHFSMKSSKRPQRSLSSAYSPGVLGKARKEIGVLAALTAQVGGQTLGGDNRVHGLGASSAASRNTRCASTSTPCT